MTLAFIPGVDQTVPAKKFVPGDQAIEGIREALCAFVQAFAEPGVFHGVDKIILLKGIRFVVEFAILSVGPFARPLIWRHRKLSRNWKFGLSVVMLALSWLLLLATRQALESLQQYDEWLL